MLSVDPRGDDFLSQEKLLFRGTSEAADDFSRVADVHGVQDVVEPLEFEGEVGAKWVSGHEDSEQLLEALAEAFVKGEGWVNWHSFLLEIALYDFALPSDLQQASDWSLYDFFILVHSLEQRLGALRKEEQFFSGWRKAFFLGLVEEVPLYQLLDVLFAEMLGIYLAL